MAHGEGVHQCSARNAARIPDRPRAVERQDLGKRGPELCNMRLCRLEVVAKAFVLAVGALQFLDPRRLGINGALPLRLDGSVVAVVAVLGRIVVVGHLRFFLPFFGFGLPASRMAIATACFGFRPALISVRMLCAMPFLDRALLPLRSGMACSRQLLRGSSGDTPFMTPGRPYLRRSAAINPSG